MKFNLKLISLMLILCFLSVSAVCAADTTQDDDVISDADADSIGNIDEDINAADDAASSSPKDFNVFQRLIWDAKEGDTVELDSDYIFTENTTREAEWGNQIDKSLTIDGKGHTLDGDSKAAILYIKNGLSNIVIKNINFVNGKKSNGGAIVAYETNYLTIQNCTFTNNKAANSVGGALMIEGSNCKITDCTFENNIAPSSGGAIRLEGNSNTLTNNKFTSNKATESLGGAISSLGHNNIFTNNIFTKNFAGRDGGAIDAEGVEVAAIGTGMIISNNVFDSNVASGSKEGSHGGAISLACEKSEVSNNNFTNNHADSVKGAPSSIGGAIRWNGNSNMGTITGNLFEGDYAQSGGAIYIAGNGISISNNKFNNNKATAGSGGALNIKGDSAVISENEITKSSATESGGAILLVGKSPKLLNNNITQASAKYDGGAAYINGASATITGNRFISNNAGGIAGALFLKGSSANIKNNEFTTNVAKSSGGAAYIESAKVTLNSNAFIDNQAGKTSVGGAIRVAGNDAKLTNNKFSGNTANVGLAYYGSGEAPTIKSNTITPKKANTERWEKTKTKLTTPTKTFKKSATKKVVITLKSANNRALKGKTIKLTVNKKTYKAKTNSKGQATITIKLTKKGTFKYTAKFGGDTYYNTISKKGTIKIK